MKTPNIMPAMREWWERNKPAPAAPRPVVPKAQRVYAPITDDERAAIAALGRVSFGSMSCGKYVAGLAKATQISEGGRHLLWRWVWRYRRQIAEKRLVAMAERMQSGPQISQISQIKPQMNSDGLR